MSCDMNYGHSVSGVGWRSVRRIEICGEGLELPMCVKSSKRRSKKCYKRGSIFGRSCWRKLFDDLAIGVFCP